MCNNYILGGGDFISIDNEQILDPVRLWQDLIIETKMSLSISSWETKSQAKLTLESDKILSDERKLYWSWIDWLFDCIVFYNISAK